ncbi:hypothetical protein C8J57DRAFT_1707170 [Mycena rebaudengoi]|nr:hypothetical protein C8J57DRAFT_1707170 [Mycena rebaudengoi]
MRTFILAFAFTAGLVSAQGVSSGCIDSLKAVLNSPDAGCLNPSALLSLFIHVGTEPPSVPDTINQWLTGVCSAGVCSDETISTVVANITTGCASDVDAFSPDLPQTLVDVVQKFYPVARSALCLKDDSTNELCVTQQLKSIEDFVGTLTTADLDLANLAPILGGAANLACTKCTKAMGSILSQQDPGIANDINAVCGADFIGGSGDQEGVSQTALNDVFVAQKPSSSAMASSTINAAVVTSLFLFSAFTFLA